MGATGDNFPGPPEDDDGSWEFDGTVCVTIKGQKGYDDGEGEEYDEEIALKFSSVEEATEAVEELNSLRIRQRALPDPEPGSDDEE